MNPTETKSDRASVDIVATVQAYEQLRATGTLDSRGSDLLAIVARERDELTHSRVIRWLLDPAGSHGFGSAILDAVLERGWGLKPTDQAMATVSARERTRIKTRADVLVEVGPRRLIVENKVDAPEQPTQCEDYVSEWGLDTLFLLISPSGSPPVSCLSEASRLAWRSMSYGALAKLIKSQDVPNSPAAAAVQSYLDTLAMQFSEAREFTIHREDLVKPDVEPEEAARTRYAAPNPFARASLRFYVEHRGAIGEIDRLTADFRAAFRHELEQLAVPIQEEVAETFGLPVAGGLQRPYSGGGAGPAVWRDVWPRLGDNPAVWVGVSWDSAQVFPEGIFVGLMARDAAETAAFRDALRADLIARPVDGWELGKFALAYRYLAAKPDWHVELAEWRQGVGAAVVDAWRELAPRVDEVLGVWRQPGIDQ